MRDLTNSTVRSSRLAVLPAVLTKAVSQPDTRLAQNDGIPGRTLLSIQPAHGGNAKNLEERREANHGCDPIN